MSNKIFYKSILIVLALAVCGNFVLAFTTEEELRDKIGESSESIESINAEIIKFQKELASISTQSNTLSNQIKQLDLTKRKLDADIKLTEAEINKDNLELELLDDEIGDTELTIKDRRLLIAENIRDIHDIESYSLVEMLAQKDSITDIWYYIDSTLSLQSIISKNIDDLEFSKVQLVSKQDKISEKLEQLALDKAKLSDQKKIIDANVAEKNRLLRDTKNQESSYNQLIKDKEALKKAFEAELQNYESQLSYILDPSTIPSVGSAPFSWPLKDAFITQQFGKTVDSVRLYASGSHSGTDFRASVGTEVYAMANGTVAGVGDTDATCRSASFGKWVLIEYDNGLAATYGHLSLIKAVKGQKVVRGQVVAYSGNTGHSTGPHLHVSMYPNDAVSVEGKESLACKGKILVQPRAATTAYLNPLDYMPKTTPSMFK